MTLADNACTTNLEDIYQVMLDETLAMEQKEFILCPNTVYDIGYLRIGLFATTIEDGQYPLILRSNTLIKCGSDGSSANNCTLRGGEFGLVNLPFLLPTDTASTNVVIQGLTFEGQDGYGVFFAKAGDIQMIDCIFQGMQNNGPVLLIYTSPTPTRRYLTVNTSKRLKSRMNDDTDPTSTLFEMVELYLRDYLTKDPKDPWEHDGDLLDFQLFSNIRPKTTGAQEERDLQSVLSLDFSFMDCKFLDNEQVSESDPYGILTAKGGAIRVVVDNCEFSGNRFDNNGGGYAILVEGPGDNTLSIRNSCFLENEFVGSGTVVLEQLPESNLEVENVYVDPGDDELGCPFVSTFETEDALENNLFTCIDSDISTCPFETTVAESTITEVPSFSTTLESSDSSTLKTTESAVTEVPSFSSTLESSDSSTSMDSSETSSYGSDNGSSMDSLNVSATDMPTTESMSERPSLMPSQNLV